MKGITKFTKKLISIAIALNLLAGNASAYSNVDQFFYLNDNKIYSGKIVPLESSDAAFSDIIDYDSLADLQFKRTISISGDRIYVDVSLFINSLEVQLTYEGQIYKSFRHTDEKPVYIGVFDNTAINGELVQIDDQINDFEIIYFEISNDTSPYNLNQDLRGSSSITMYLRSKEGTIYDLGSQIDSPIVLEGIEKQAPSDKDINWFLDFFNGTYDEVQNDSTRSSMSSVWTGNTHVLRYQIANYEHKFTALPYIDFSYGDVPTAGVMPFSMSLKISESHRYREVGTTTWISNQDKDYSKCFEINNVQLTWTAGGNTEIKYVSPHLNIPVQGGGNFNFVGFAAAVTGISPQTAPLSSILTVADSILGLSTGSSRTFTNTAYGGALSNTRAYKIKFPANYYIDESSAGLPNPQAERFEYVAFMATSNSNLSRAYWTYAIADFTFTLSWADITGQSGSKVYTAYKELGYYTNY